MRLVHEPLATHCHTLNEGLDIIAVTYYPLDAGFLMLPPEIVGGDFDDLVAEYADLSQPIYFAEMWICKFRGL